MPNLASQAISRKNFFDSLPPELIGYLFTFLLERVNNGNFLNYLKTLEVDFLKLETKHFLAALKTCRRFNAVAKTEMKFLHADMPDLFIDKYFRFQTKKLNELKKANLEKSKKYLLC